LDISVNLLGVTGELEKCEANASTNSMFADFKPISLTEVSVETHRLDSVGSRIYECRIPSEVLPEGTSTSGMS